MSDKLYVFVDETGTPNLGAKETLFGLQAVCIKSSEYKALAQAWSNLKFNFWDNDFIIFHAHKIRKKEGAFSIFQQSQVLISFAHQVISILEKTPLQVFLIGVDIKAYKQKYRTDLQFSPYHTTLAILLEKIGRNYTGKSINLYFESRGKNEDSVVREEFNQLMLGKSDQHWINYKLFSQKNINLEFFSKKEKICGLEIADFYGYEFRRLFHNKPSKGWEALKKKLAPHGYKILP